MQRFSAHFLVSALVLTACPADTNEPTTTTEASSGSGSSTSATTAGPTTMEPTTDPTTGTPTTDPTTGTPTTDPTTTGPTTEPTTDPTTTDATTADDTTTDDQTTGPVGPCGDGVLDNGEACDDANMSTEISPATKTPLTYEADACIDDCSLVLSLCGNGDVDPGEACDDGNQDSYDDCTTSCTVNDQSFHAPCKRMCNDKCDTDVTSGTFTGCDNMEVPANAEAVCYVSTKFNIAPRYFAEGECAVTAQKCKGAICPPAIGDYDAFSECPAGTTLVDRTTDTFGVVVNTKVCQKTCDSDSDCRWNAFDTIWAKSGQYRCQTTDDSNGVKICADAQN